MGKEPADTRVPGCFHHGMVVALSIYYIKTHLDCWTFSVGIKLYRPLL